jgi:hypothetical protein
VHTGCTELQEISLRRCINGVTDAGIVPVLQANPALTKIDLWVRPPIAPLYFFIFISSPTNRR